MSPHIPYAPQSHTPAAPGTPTLGVGGGGNPNVSHVLGNVGTGTGNVNAPWPTTTATAVYLTLPLMNSITAAFRSRSSDYSRKVHRVFLSKLDYLATDLRGGGSGGEVGSGAGAAVSDEDDGSGVGGRVVRKSGVTGGGRRGGAGAGAGAGGGSERGDGSGGGGQLLSGIGTLASGLGFSGSGNGAGGLLEPTSDLSGLVRVLVAGEKGRDKDRERHKDNAREGGEGRGTAASLKGLWGGRIGVVVRMRERERDRLLFRTGELQREREKEREKAGAGTAGTVWSDGDTDGGKTTEDEGEFMFGGIPWSGKVQKKLEMWTKLVVNRPFILVVLEALI